MSSEFRTAASTFGSALAAVYLPHLERFAWFLSTLDGTSPGAEAAMHRVATRLVAPSTRRRRALYYRLGLRRQGKRSIPVGPVVGFDTSAIERSLEGFRKTLEAMAQPVAEAMDRITRSPLGQALIEAERKRRLEAGADVAG